MRLGRLANLRLCVALSACFLLGGDRLTAQALSTANKAAEITAFGGYMVSDPDFGSRSYNGFGFGAGFTLFPHFFIDPSFEVRYDHTTAGVVSEHAFLVGPRAQKDYGRFHPYANFLVGAGGINYNTTLPVAPTDHRDSGVSLSYGGGVDIDVSRNISAKVDLQQQHWDLGKDPNLQPIENYTLTPRTLIFGVTYHIPFSGLRKQRELR